MDEERLEKLIEETLSAMDPVEVPEDLHFDAAAIMRMAKMEEEEETDRKTAPITSPDHKRKTFRSRSWTRFAAAAAAFVVLLGIYAIWKSGSAPVPGPGTDPGSIAEVDGPDVQPVPPENVPVEPVRPDDPVTPDEPVEPPAEEDPGAPQAPVSPPQQPVQSAQNPKPPAVTPPAPQPPAAEPEEPATDPEPPVEEDPGEVDPGSEYAGGLEVDPEDPGDEPDEQPGAEPEDPEEDVFEAMLQEALQDEEFAAAFAEEDKGFGYDIRSVEDVPEGTEFMVYFYESEEEQLAGTVNEDNIRSILWKKESL